MLAATQWEYDNLEVDQSEARDMLVQEYEEQIDQLTQQYEEEAIAMGEECQHEINDLVQQYETQAVSFAAHGEQRSDTFAQTRAVNQDDEEEDSTNYILAAIFGVLVITILGLLCLVRDLQARLAEKSANNRPSEVGQHTGDSFEIPPMSRSVEGT